MNRTKEIGHHQYGQILLYGHDLTYRTIYIRTLRTARVLRQYGKTLLESGKRTIRSIVRMITGSVRILIKNTNMITLYGKYLAILRRFKHGTKLKMRTKLTVGIAQIIQLHNIIIQSTNRFRSEFETFRSFKYK